MIIQPSPELLKHLKKENVKAPEGGFLVSDEEYKSASDLLAQSHGDESPEAFKDRVDFYLIHNHYGVQQNGKGAEAVTQHRMAAIAHRVAQLTEVHLPKLASDLSEGVALAKQAVDEGHAKVVGALSELKTFEGESHAEILRVKTEFYDSILTLAQRAWKFTAGALGAIIVLLAVMVALSASGHCQIDVIRFQDNAGAAVGTVAAPFIMKAGSNCSLAKSGPTVTFNCTGGAAAAGGSNTQVQYNNATALGGISTFTTDGTANTAKVGTNWSFVDPTDATKKFQFDASNIAAGATRIVNIPNAASTTVQPDTGAANNYISAISAQGVITKSQPAYANLSGLPTLPVTKTAAAGQPLLSYDSTTGAFTQAALTAANVGLGSVTNDAQTKAAVVPNTAPSAGQMLIGNAGGTAYVPLSLSQDCTIASTGAITCTKTNNVAFGGGATMSTTAGGDLSGTLPSPTVAKVNGIAYSNTAASHSVEVITTANTTATAKVIPDCTDATGNHLNYTQSTDAFSCGTSDSHLGTVTSVSGTTNEIASTGGATPVLSIASTFDIHGKTSTAPIKAGTTAAAPVTCQANIELYIKTDATAGQQVFICNGTGNGWVLVGDGGGAGSSPGGSNTQVQFNDSTAFGGAVGLTYNKTTQTTTFTGAGATGAAINVASQTTVTTPNAGDCWLSSNIFQCFIQAATNGGFVLYDQSGNTRTDDTTGTVTTHTVHHPAAAPTYVAHEQTDACGSSTCTESWHMDPIVMMVGTSDFVTAANTSLQAITGLSFTFPANVAQKASIDCYLLYNQQTAAVADAFGIQDVTVAPTNINASAFVQTAATTIGYANLAALASTTATNIITMTPSAITTVWQAQLHIAVEHPSNASSSVLQIMAKTGTAADTLTVKRGSYCTANFQ